MLKIYADIIERLNSTKGGTAYNKLQSNLLSTYIEGHTKSVLLIRSTYYRYGLT